MANYAERYQVATIYSLADPRDGKVRYVGRTVLPLGTRLNGHIFHAKDSEEWHVSHNPKEGWVKELYLLGLRPLIEELEVVPSTECNRAEKFWIQYLRFVGCDLLNQAGTDKPHYRKTEQYKNACRLRDENAKRQQASA
jgi:hypothetical protein